MPDKPSFVFAVLNWNGVATTWKGDPLLDFSLPSLIAACQEYSGRGVVAVIDNASTDESVAYVESEYPGVRIIENENRYLFSYNDAASRFEEDVIVCVNSDIRVESNILGCLADVFRDDSVFSAGPDICDWDSLTGPTGYSGSRCVRIQYCRGRLFPVDVGGAVEKNLPAPHYVLGACAAYRRTYFRELGGFDEVYYPYFWEDCDIAVRARQRGWKNIVDERTRAYHLGRHSIDPTHVNPGPQHIHLRNEYIFFFASVKNIFYKAASFFYLCVHAFHYPYGSAFSYLKAFFMAWVRFLDKGKRFSSDLVREFSNIDLNSSTRAYIRMSVYFQAGSNSRSLARAVDLASKEHDNEFLKYHISRCILQNFAALFRKRKYRTVLRWYRKIDQRLFSEEFLYIVASSLRELRRSEKARAVYSRITKIQNGNPRIIGASWYHSAVLSQNESKKEDVLNMCRACLEYLPEHRKCRELLESLNSE